MVDAPLRSPARQSTIGQSSSMSSSYRQQEYKCKGCNDDFLSLLRLQHHMDSYSHAEPKRFICPFEGCDESLSIALDRPCHIKKHPPSHGVQDHEQQEMHDARDELGKGIAHGSGTLHTSTSNPADDASKRCHSDTDRYGPLSPPTPSIGEIRPAG